MLEVYRRHGKLIRETLPRYHLEGGYGLPFPHEISTIKPQKTVNTFHRGD